MAWHIAAGINNGYPFEDGFPMDFQTSFTSDDAHQYPYAAWRIKDGVNNGYPWKFWWYEEPVSDSGDMEIGGGQSNYPDGFTGHDDGGIDDQFNNDDMDFNDDLIDFTNETLAEALEGKMFGLTQANLQQVIHCLSKSSLVGSNANLIQSIYGADVFKGIIMCRTYPFTLQFYNVSPLPDYKAKLFGVYPLYDEDTSQYNHGFTGYVNAVQHFSMGSVVPHIYQAWEVENIEYYIYLPFAGTYPIDVRKADLISVDLFVDVFTGAGEYIIKQNYQMIGSYKCQLGFDFPLRTAESAMRANMVGSLAATVTPVLTAAATGAAGPAAGMAVNMAGSALSQHHTISTPQIGGLTSVYAYPRARLLAKIPKMFNDAYGYHETLGANRSTTYEHLNNCSGYTQCKNYKCDIIVATEDEKTEIERLMNEGVML